MTCWKGPQWRVQDLVPSRIYGARGFARTLAEVHALAHSVTRDEHRAVPTGRAHAETASVLLGGAGFLGARIAARLLEREGDAPVVIVSRRPATVHSVWTSFLGRARADAFLADGRLMLVSADLERPGMEWTAQVPRAGRVFHLAARVHAMAGWKALAPVNLGSLQCAMALARRDGALLQLASTLSVFASSNNAHEGMAQALPSSDDVWLFGGYAQTKAAGEVLLNREGTDFPWQVVRHGLLIPEPGHLFPADHFLPVLVRALVSLGALPPTAEMAWMDATPVDAAARLSLEVSEQAGSRWTHCANPGQVTLRVLLEAVHRASWPQMSEKQWQTRLVQLPALVRALVSSAIDKSAFLSGWAAGAPVLNADIFQSTHRSYLQNDHPSAGLMPEQGTLLHGLVSSLQQVPGMGQTTDTRRVA